MQADALRKHIKDSLPHYESLGVPEPLSGGLLNYVWRIPANPHPIIAKYSPPFIASAPEIAMDEARSTFEAAALSWWAQHHNSDDRIRPPRLLHADGERSVILMEDVGPAPDLGEALKQLSLVEATTIGHQLGNFLAQLHRETFQDEALAKGFQNEGVQNVRIAVQYNQLIPLEKASIPQAQAIAARIKEVGKWITKSGICLIMGDLWPPSILLAAQGLRIIDWEFTHFGWPVQDVAHLSSHLWMQAHMADSPTHNRVVQSCLLAFLQSYAAARGERLVEAEPRWLYPIHIGAEILARTIGNFQSGYLYEALTFADPRMQKAVDFATQCVLNPSEDTFFGPYFAA